jgi:hypothetical protein
MVPSRPICSITICSLSAAQSTKAVIIAMRPRACDIPKYCYILALHQDAFIAAEWPG